MSFQSHDYRTTTKIILSLKLTEKKAEMKWKVKRDFQVALDPPSSSEELDAY